MEDGSYRAPRARRSTLVAGGLAVLASLPYIAAGVRALAGFDAAEVAGLAEVGIPVEVDGWMLTVAGSVTLVLGLWALLLGAAILARRSFARNAGLLTFFAFAVVSVPLPLVGLAEGASGAPLGLLTGVASVITVVLLFSSTTNDDIDRASFARQQRRHLDGAGRGGAGLAQ